MAERLTPLTSRIDALKRQLYDALTNPKDYLSMVGGRAAESLYATQQLQKQAFSDPRNPFKVTNENALRQLTDALMSGPLGFAPAGITAYHGSPYLFKQFDPMKVGTGEGAQAYGVGAGYTAEARPVAEWYRSAITKDRYATQDGIFQPSSLEHLNVKATLRKDGLDKAIEVAKKYAVPDSDYPEVAAKAARDLQILEGLKGSGGIKPMQGYLYKGDIPDEIIPSFLDWDKPLSQQSKEVQKALAKIDPDSFSPKGDDYAPEELGQMIYARIANSPLAKTQGEASAVLERFGIRGIRYLDQTSRGGGKGTSNFVPFRPEDFKIQEINDRPLEEYIAQGLLAP